jgi:hypothetical protein
MPLDYPLALNLAGLLLFAFLLNLPLGFLREASSRYSLRWFIYIHLSIPFIIVLRLREGFGWKIIPLTIACAVFGQVLGGRIRRRSKT